MQKGLSQVAGADAVAKTRARGVMILSQADGGIIRAPMSREAAEVIARN
jgi:hypothetical protein